jgi:hypothetical protein
MADISPQPTNATPLESAREPEIHVMPDKFLGVAARATLPPVQRPLAEDKPRAPVVAAVVAEQRGPGKGLLIAGGLVIVLLGVIAVAIWYPRGNKPTQPVVTPPINQNTNTTPQRPIATTTPVIATSTPAIIASSTPPVDTTPLRNATDRDADGLTDVEEREMYGTDPANVDTDADNYLDGGEVFYLYNPAAIAPVTLRESGIVRVVNEPSLGIATLIPLSWTRRPLEDGVVFTGATGEFIQITSQANPLGLSLSVWYRQFKGQQSDGTPIAFSNRLGTVGLKSLDGLNAYFANGNRMFIVSYGTAGTRELSYRRTFEMVLNSFETIAVASTLDTPPSAAASSTVGVATSTPSAATASGTPAVVPSPTGTTPAATSTPLAGTASSTQ